MRAAFTLLLLSSPALGAVARVSPLPVVPALPFVAAPRLSLQGPSVLAPALSAPSLGLVPVLSAANDAPKPADEAVAAPAPASTPLEAGAAEAAAEAQAAPSRPETDIELERLKAARVFDGAVVKPMGPYETLLTAPEAAHPGWSVRAAKDEDAEWLAGVVAALRESRTGRRVLKEVDAMSVARGRAVLVDVARLSNNAEVRYDSGLLVMDKNHRRKPVRLAAPIMAHELQHVLQKAADFIPADALEMEVESYTIEARVWNELGIKPPPNSFARKAKNRLEKDPIAFVYWLAEEYPKNRMLHGKSDESYVQWVEAERAKAAKRLAAAEKRIQSIERVLARMRAAGTPAAQVEAHRHDDLIPAEASRRDYRLMLAWLDRDLKLLSTPEGRKRFREYSRAVIRRAKAMALPSA